MPFGKSDVFIVPPLPSNWGNPFIPAKAAIAARDAAAPMADCKPSFANDPEKKRQFGIELAKRKNQINAAFGAGLAVFGDNVQAALWVQREWINDPIVQSAHEECLQALASEKQTLDREQFALKLLELIEAKNIQGTHYIYEDKERVNLLELYAKVMGFTDKHEASITNNNLIQGLTIKLVKPEVKEEVHYTASSNEQIQNQNELPIKLKLVG